MGRFLHEPLRKLSHSCARSFCFLGTVWLAKVLMEQGESGPTNPMAVEKKVAAGLPDCWVLGSPLWMGPWSSVATCALWIAGREGWREMKKGSFQACLENRARVMESSVARVPETLCSAVEHALVVSLDGVPGPNQDSCAHMLHLCGGVLIFVLWNRALQSSKGELLTPVLRDGMPTDHILLRACVVLTTELGPYCLLCV